MALDRWEGGGRYTGLASPTSGIAARWPTSAMRAPARVTESEEVATTTGG